MNKWLFLATLAFAVPAQSADRGKSCSVLSCDVGQSAVTQSTAADFYFACPTRELSEYVSTMWGMVAFTRQMTGKLPNISPVTGEPEFEGSSKQMLDDLRAGAGVSTYDQAQAMCAKGKSKLLVTVMNNPQDAGSIWVAASDKKAFWMPKAFLYKQ